MEKVFDKIDRNLLFYRLLLNNINGKMYKAIRSLYTDCKCSININGFLIDTFVYNAGVKQGDILSPTLFNFYINDLANEIKRSNLRIDMSNLMYADDIALVSDSERNMQSYLILLTIGVINGVWILMLIKQI